VKVIITNSPVRGTVRWLRGNVGDMLEEEGPTGSTAMLKGSIHKTSFHDLKIAPHTSLDLLLKESNHYLNLGRTECQ
jgi:hypothetical protein